MSDDTEVGRFHKEAALFLRRHADNAAPATDDELGAELWVLLRLCHENGQPEDGPRFREAVQNVRKLVGYRPDSVSSVQVGGYAKAAE
jgi:hypothetical protein